MIEIKPSEFEHNGYYHINKARKTMLKENKYVGKIILVKDLSSGTNMWMGKIINNEQYLATDISSDNPLGRTSFVNFRKYYLITEEEKLAISL